MSDVANIRETGETINEIKKSDKIKSVTFHFPLMGIPFWQKYFNLVSRSSAIYVLRIDVLNFEWEGRNILDFFLINKIKF